MVFRWPIARFREKEGSIIHDGGRQAVVRSKVPPGSPGQQPVGPGCWSIAGACGMVGESRKEGNLPGGPGSSISPFARQKSPCPLNFAAPVAIGCCGPATGPPANRPNVRSARPSRRFPRPRCSHRGLPAPSKPLMSLPQEIFRGPIRREPTLLGLPVNSRPAAFRRAVRRRSCRRISGCMRCGEFRGRGWR